MSHFSVSGFGHIKFIHNLFDAQRIFPHTNQRFSIYFFCHVSTRKFDLHIFAINSIPLISISIKYPSAHSDQFSPSHIYAQQIRPTFVAPFPIFRVFFSLVSLQHFSVCRNLLAVSKDCFIHFLLLNKILRYPIPLCFSENNFGPSIKYKSNDVIPKVLHMTLHLIKFLQYLFWKFSTSHSTYFHLHA